jgi:serine/threonine-protein kinase
MSVVYLAINEKANKTWAVKEVRKDGVQDFEVVRQGLMAETDILKKLNHSNLPSIIDVIDGEGSFLIVMDYIEGITLEKSMKESGGAQPQKYVIDWAKELCDVLGYLHANGIIYRDMKPSNVMLKPDGHVTLIDFGTARTFKEHQVEDTQCLGTIGYAAPEQYGGHGQTDARTDIFCLGATMYHMVTGHNPSKYPYEMYPIRQINPALSPGLEKIILKCTQKNPEMRYQSCAELLYALEHYNELDDVVIGRNKRKMAGFVTTAALTLIFAGVSLFSWFGYKNTIAGSYESLVVTAEDTNYQDVANWKKYYKQAVELNPSAAEAYESLANKIVEGDGSFTEEESEALIQIVKAKGDGDQRYQDLFKSAHPMEYFNFAYDIGRYYLFNYESSSARMTNSSGWFDSMLDIDVEKLGADDNELSTLTKKKARAQIYYNIADSNSKFNGGTDESGESGAGYMEYMQNLSSMIDGIDLSSQKNDADKIAILRMYRFFVTEVYTKAQSFRQDDVQKSEIEEILDIIKDSTEEIANDNPGQVPKKLCNRLLNTDSSESNTDSSDSSQGVSIQEARDMLDAVFQ